MLGPALRLQRDLPETQGRPHPSLAQSPPTAPISLGVKTKDFTVAHSLSTPSLPPPLPAFISSRCPPLPSHQPPQTTQSQSHPRDFALALLPRSHMVPSCTAWRQWIIMVWSMDSKASLGSDLSPASSSYVNWGNYFTFVSSSVEWRLFKVLVLQHWYENELVFAENSA